MYIYAPGAGCMGDAKLVAPGDELIFSTSTQWQDREAPLLSEVQAKEEPIIASTCLLATETVWSFKPPLPEQDLVELIHKNFSAETMKKVQWAVKMYCEWRVHHHSMGLEHIPCDLDDRATISATSLHHALCRFIMEVKKVNGDDFPGKTLYNILVCMQFHLECLGFAFQIINDVAFRDIKFTLDNTMKARVASGIGISVRQAQVLLATDEDYLWSLGYLGSSYPDQLLSMLVFCVGKGFALRAGKEHRALRAIPFDSQFSFHHDEDHEIYLQYKEDIGTKTNKGGLKHKNIDAKTVVMYASDRPERCPLCMILKYMSLLPKTCTCQAFYLQPWKKFFEKSWYLNRPAGVNKLRNVVAHICHEAGLPGYYTNHSLCSTAATKMHQKDLDEQLIMEVMGHWSTAVHGYKRTSQRQKKMASKCIFAD